MRSDGQQSRVLGAMAEAATELDQAIRVLEAAGWDDAASLPVGVGDRGLLALARTISAREIELIAECPDCGTLSGATLTPQATPAPTPRVALLASGGGVREPTYADLRDLPDDPQAAVRELLQRCVVGSPRRAPTPDDLSFVDDSLCGPVLIACSECGRMLAVEADVERLALERLDQCARERDREIHLIAATYRWTLAEIEALPKIRRRRLSALIAGER